LEVLAGRAATVVLNRLAGRGHGIVGRRELLDAGIMASTIDSWLAGGRLTLVHRGVYAVGHMPHTLQARARAAVLACGPGTIVGVLSAGGLVGLITPRGGPVDVIAPGRHVHPGIRVHQARDLAAVPWMWRDGIPLTTIARTLLDLTDVLDDAALDRAVNLARSRYGVRIDELERQLAGANGRRGAVRLRPHILRGGAPTRSAFEDAFLRFLDKHRLPRPEVNVNVAGYEVDALWRREQFIVELDGRAYHETVAAFEKDRLRDTVLAASANCQVIRLTWWRLHEQPREEANMIRAILAHRSKIYGRAGR
jgi:very-short-patch-repair endonuclease